MICEMEAFYTQTAGFYINPIYGDPVTCCLIFFISIFNAQPFSLMNSFKDILEDLVLRHFSSFQQGQASVRSLLLTNSVSVRVV